MSLKIYNSLGRKKEEFKPLEDGKVKMYVCGPTVYDLLHVGNFRGAIVFNLVRNWLEHLGYKVNFVYNYTDIDDKIINRANEEGIDPLALSQKYIEEFKKDFNRLGLSPHDANPKCSDHMQDMIDFIGSLIEKKYAYEAEGSVFYSIDAFKPYGKLSGKDIDTLQAGHRVDPDPRKHNALDFILWKPAKEGEPSWKAPWGAGRPGWHIECSAMNHSIFGDQIDIHGGGIDLTFPHHENEIAQSEALTGKTFAKYWMHNNFINFDNEKMSKSVGNVFKARDFMNQYHPEIFKFMMLNVHYRSSLNLAKEQINQAIAGLDRIYSLINICEQIVSNTKDEGVSDSDGTAIEDLKKSDEEIFDALNDDFNTPRMFAVIFNVVRGYNDVFGSWKKNKKITGNERANAKRFLNWLKKYGEITALFQEPAEEFLKTLNNIFVKEKNINVEEVESLIVKRNKARAEKDFKTADSARDQLNDLGIIVHDGIDGSSWEVKKT